MKTPVTLTVRSILLRLAYLACLASCACGSPAPSRVGGLEIMGDLIERSEGYAARPEWADLDRPWSRQGETLRVVGYVAIRGDQRKEVGYRAADSYARAELVRFLSVRVISVLEDRVNTNEGTVLRERIDQVAQSWVDNLTIAQRYFERRKSGDEDKVHLFSRLDLDQASVAELLLRAAKDATNLRTSPEELKTLLAERWQRIADVAGLNQGDAALPTGVVPPSWARGGDRVTDVGFEFVCSGTAKDDKTARAVARARCNEKLCRLFGVQITAKSTVTETLEGVQAQSEVSEQCASVRAVGRVTRYQGGECGPQGCVQWLMQTYPRSAYEEEKARLDKPTIIRQQVVIQEGSKHYRDPAACESSLRAFNGLQGYRVEAFIQRKQHLEQAMRVCQGIDGRESGLFLTLNTLLTSSLPNFTVESERNVRDEYVNVRRAFTIASPSWRQNLETQRFLTDRITAVLELVKGAVLPLGLLDARDNGTDAQTLDALMREVVKAPFVAKPASVHHAFYLHNVALSLARSKAPYSARYRNYLLEVGEKGQFTCSSKDQIPGAEILEYLAADGQLDEREWRLALKFMQTPERWGPDSCNRVIWAKYVDHGSLRYPRIEQIAELIVSGATRAADMADAFESLVDAVRAEERLPLFRRYQARLTGSERAKSRLVEKVLKSAFSFEWDWERNKRAEGIEQCTTMPARIGNFFAEQPQASVKVTGLCQCLRLDGLSPPARRSIAQLLFRYSDENCNAIRVEDWPEEYYKAESPKYLPASGGPYPFRGHPNFLEHEFKQCLADHLKIERETVETYVTATHRAGRFSNIDLKVTIVGELKTFSYPQNLKRRGFVRKSEVDGMTRSIEACMRTAMSQFQVPAVWLKPEETGPRRVWFQFWDGNFSTQGYVQ